MTSMEWVETTARTVEEAKDAALDRLGVDEQDAEFEVLEEPRSGLFGRLRGEARVRARVRPTTPRPKLERRERRRRNESSGRRGRGSQRGGTTTERATPADKPSKQRSVPAATAAPAQPDTPADSTTETTPSAAPGRNRRRRNRTSDLTHQAPEETTPTMTETELRTQGEVVQGFLDDLLDAFDLDAEVALDVVEEDAAVELSVSGDDLGLLIGPKGQTLQAIQELCRSVLQRNLPGESHARVRVDVAGYRQRRKEALQRFASQVASQVLASGSATALEPMSPPDRKIVHDAVNEIDGVTTTSEGEEPRRRVVIRPA